MEYKVDERILNNYADVLVNFALNSGKGVKKGEVVLLQVPECAKDMLISLRRKVLEAGAHPIIQYLPDGISREFFEIANDEQLDFFPEKYMLGKAEDMDHSIAIIAETDKKELDGVDPQKIMRRSKSVEPYRKALDKKEGEGRFTWTLGLYGTQAMADEAGLSLEEYWNEIIKACFLDYEDPKEEWRKVSEELERIKEKLNSLEIDSVRVESEGTDLRVKLGNDRKWLGGSGRNIPSFELFISPDWRGTEGYISFNQPLYRYGNLIKDVYLEFEGGRVVKSSASEGEKVLKEMIATENADKVGEFSLTDGRMSRITKFMAETLYDENVGGEQGNTHIALGKAYKDSYVGDPSELDEKDWEERGFNDSPVHTDIVSTKRRKVTATLSNGEDMVIYEDGKFRV